MKLVDPPTAVSVVIAFSNACLVRMSEGLTSFLRRLNTASPARREDASLR